MSEINVSKGQHGTIVFYNINRVFEELEKREDVIPEELAKRELVYLPCFNHRTKPLTLHRLIVERPELFIEAICAVFKPASAEARDLSEGEIKLAKAAYELLGNLRLLPGQTDQDIKIDTLLRWCTDVRQLAKEKDRSKVTDLTIGHLLALLRLVRTTISGLMSQYAQPLRALHRMNWSAASL